MQGHCKQCLYFNSNLFFKSKLKNVFSLFEPVAKEVALAGVLVIVEEVAALLDLTHLLAQGHCLLHVWDVVFLDQLVLQQFTHK